MRWSNVFSLANFDFAPSEGGVYEIGTFRKGVFQPEYVGKADKSIHSRLEAHANGRGNQSVREYLDIHQRSHLYARFMRAADPQTTEANLLDKFGIGRDGGSYTYNRRYERKQ